MLHHPLQIHEPELLSVFDPERQTTLKSRRWALHFAADHAATFFSSHFPATSAGFVTRRAETYDWSVA